MDVLRKRRGSTGRNESPEPSFLPGPDWVQPWWLARQRDPSHGAYHPSPTAPVNAVGRSWTLVGTLDGVMRVAVDPRGLVVGRPGRWSLDWWVKAGERWMFPSTTPGVRQRLVGGAPVVETLMRVGGGDVAHRCYGANARPDVIVVELENTSTEPVAIALSLRPYDVQGGGRIHHARCDDRVVEIDGEVAVVMGRRPGAVVTGTGGADPGSKLLGLEEPEPTDSPLLHCQDGMGAMSLVVPLVHGSTMRLALVAPGTRAGEVAATLVDELPSAEAVARGWANHAVGGCRVVLPAGRIAEGFDAVRQSLPLAVVTGSTVDPVPLGPPAQPGDRLEMVTALAELGYPTICRDVLLSWARQQDRLGAIEIHGHDLTAEVLLAISRVHALHPDPVLLEALAEVVADGVRWLIEQARDPLVTSALGVAGPLLSEVGAHGAAAELVAVVGEIGAEPDSVGPEGGGLVEDRVRPLGFDCLTSARVALADVRKRRGAGLDRLDALLDQSSSCWGWPTHVHPRLGTGTGGAGHDLRVGAVVARAVRRLLVDDDNPQRWALMPLWPAAWIGQPVEVHGLACTRGLLSFAVRWHGERPALLWEVEPATDRRAAEELVVTAPGLDPLWSGTGLQGEALLAPVPAGHDLGTEPPNGENPPAGQTSFS